MTFQNGLCRLGIRCNVFFTENGNENTRIAVRNRTCHARAVAPQLIIKAQRHAKHPVAIMRGNE